MVSSINSISTISVYLTDSPNTQLQAGAVTSHLVINIPDVTGYDQYATLFGVSGKAQYLGTIAVFPVSNVTNPQPYIMSTYAQFTTPTFTITCLNAEANVFIPDSYYQFGTGITTPTFSIMMGRFFAGIPPSPPPPVEPLALKAETEPQTTEEPQPTTNNTEETPDELLADALNEELPSDLTNSVLIQAINLVKLSRTTNPIKK
jgi:hypothetical protein